MSSMWSGTRHSVSGQRWARFMERDGGAIRDLPAALQVRDLDLEKKYSFMTPGDLTLALLPARDMNS